MTHLPSLEHLRRARRPPQYVATPYCGAWAVQARDVFWGTKMKNWVARPRGPPLMRDLTATQAKAEAALLNGE